MTTTDVKAANGTIKAWKKCALEKDPAKSCSVETACDLAPS